MLALTIKADDQAMRQTVRDTDRKMMPAIAPGMERGLLHAAAVSQREYLHGPRPARLGTVTTRLQGSIATEVKLDSKTVVGRFGSNVRYAGYHEFGFKGVENVKGFYRALHPGGKRAAMRLRKGAVGVGFVRSHTRRVDYPGKPFLRPALAAAVPVIEREIQGALALLAKGEA